MQYKVFLLYLHLYNFANHATRFIIYIPLMLIKCNSIKQTKNYDIGFDRCIQYYVDMMKDLFIIIS